ncbi:MAG TPA: hypothetical protein VGF17_05070, partial [Phytomonospora sp.]
ATARVEQILKDANTGNPIRVDVFVGEPKAVMDSDQRAHAYLAIFPSPGVLSVADQSVSGHGGPRDWRFQVTAAGGDVARCIKAVQRAQDVLVETRLDDSTGLVREDGDPGAIRPDTTVSPTRWFVPLLFVVEL